MSQNDRQDPAETYKMDTAVDTESQPEPTAPVPAEPEPVEVVPANPPVEVTEEGGGANSSV